jgi:hypothetical protein
MANTNLLPKFDKWEKVSHEDTNGEVGKTWAISVDGYSCSFTVTNESSYIRYRIQDTITTMRGHTLKLRVENFTSSDNSPILEIRDFTDLDNYVYTRVRLNYEDYLSTMPFEYDITISTDCKRLEIRFGHNYDSDGIDPPATLTVVNPVLIDTYKESPITLNFHKVLEENLPKSVPAGTQHIYYTTDGTTVKQYISNQEGYLIPVGGSGSGGSPVSDKYFNSYTQAHIDERKEEIINLTRQGHCITFAVITDIHVRIEDGDAGRYNQVRDFIMLSEQLPLDYILCEGDIMSYCQEWDKVYEPRCEKVRKILDQCRCPWFVVRGNHDFNEDDNNPSLNPNIKEFNAENCKDYFITDRDWHRSIVAKMPKPINFEFHFDKQHPQNGYFYVDDYEHKHRMVFCNTEETMENDLGEPYVNVNGEVDAFLAEITSEAQLAWFIDEALNMKDKEDRANWVVSFHSHKVPYSDRGTDSVREFHGYGWYDDPENGDKKGECFRKLLYAFQTGGNFEFKVSSIDVDNHNWYTFERVGSFSAQGPIKVLGWFGGHLHDDAYSKVDDLNIHVSTCTCPSQRTSWANDLNPTKLPPARNSTNLAMSVNVFVVNLDTRMINVIKVGSKRDNEVKTSSDLEFSYDVSTPDKEMSEEVEQMLLDFCAKEI